jgi:predicted MFS family arabinose efflux permease
MQQALLDHLAPPDRLNEAQAFLSASNTTGAAVGTAIAGIVIDVGGVPWSFGGAALGVLGAAGVALLNRRAGRSLAANLDQPAEPESAVTAVSRVAQSAK